MSLWRVATNEINYLWFFGVNQLAAIRMEEPEVFAKVHSMIFRLLRAGIHTGFRIDHIDDLLEPETYLEQLQNAYQKAL